MFWPWVPSFGKQNEPWEKKETQGNVCWNWLGLVGLQEREDCETSVPTLPHPSGLYIPSSLSLLLREWQVVDF